MSGLTPLSRARACRAACSMPRVPGLRRLVTVAPMALNGTRTLRGALAGAAGAAVWAAQSPLDKRVFGVDYDDVELLGKLVTRDPAWHPIGIAAPARTARGTRAARGTARAPRDLAGGAAARPRASRGGRFPGPVGEPAGVRAGHLAPRAVRVRDRGARAAPQPARRRPGADRRRGRRLERPRLGRAPRRRRAGLSRRRVVIPR